MRSCCSKACSTFSKLRIAFSTFFCPMRRIARRRVALKDCLTLGNCLEFTEPSPRNPHSHAGDPAKDVRLRGKSEPPNALR